MAGPGIATAIETKIDTLVIGWTNLVSASFATLIIPLAVVGFTIYITLLGWQIMRGEASDPVHVITKRLMMLALVSALALGAGLYQNVVVASVNAAQGLLIQGVNASTITGGAPVALTIGGMVDNIGTVYGNLYNLLAQNFVMAKIVPNFAIIIAALIVAVAEFVVVIVAVGVYLLAKIELALCLAVGPVFILLYAFEQTRDWTRKWIGQLFHYAIQVALIAASISLLQGMLTQFATATYNNYANNGAGSVFADVFALFVVSAVVAVLIKNIGELARALSGAVGSIGHDSLLQPLSRAQRIARREAAPGVTSGTNSISQAGSANNGRTDVLPAAQSGTMASLA